MSLPPAVIMNMFYTGLGIARSLGEQGVPCIGLTAQKRIYGNFTRYSKTVFCPDSRSQPDELLDWLLAFGRKLESRAVLFPTRDDDLVFLDRYRSQLENFFIPVAPERAGLHTCLNKWETYLAAERAGVPAPKCWLIDGKAHLRTILSAVRYPCVLKPVAAWQWRKAGAWQAVGARKAIGISSEQELLAEYSAISRADTRALLQEMVPGGDENLVIAACYLDRSSRCLAMFNTQKLVQVPQGFGTGCIVQSVHRPELRDRTIRLLESIGFSGIAEVEYKWDAGAGDYKLIEVNPRPWDQHRLGNASGVDLIRIAYYDSAGIPTPAVTAEPQSWKWIAEDVFLTSAIRSIWHRDGDSLRSLLKTASGKRVYGIWSWKDPLPFLVYMFGSYGPRLAADVVRQFWSAACRHHRQGSTAPQKV